MQTTREEDFRPNFFAMSKYHVVKFINTTSYSESYRFGERMPERRMHHSIRYYLTIAILLVAILFISLFSFFSYTEAKNDLLEKNRALQDQTEQHLTQSVILLDKGLRLFDATFDFQLKQAFKPYIEEYERVGTDPSLMDFAQVKQDIESRIEGNIDLYMIGEDGIIQYTTFEPDLGMDFKQWPDVYSFLTNLRVGDNFSADRIVYGPSKVLRKYAYQPTPDHRYLLELGVVVEGYKEERAEFSYKKIAEDAVIGNPNIVGVYFYDSTGRMIGKSEYEPDENVIGLVHDAYEQKTTLVTVDEGNNSYTRFLYLDLNVGEYASSTQMNIIAQVIYSNAGLDAELANLFNSHLLITLLAIFTGVIFAFFTSYFISRPVNEILADIEQIAGGDLDHEIGGGSGTEFARLRQSINTMVAALKQNIDQIRKSEAKIKCYSENLEEMVNWRTANLQRVNEQLNLYIEILTHNIHLSTDTAISYLRLLAGRLKGETKALAEQALASAEESADTLNYVDIIRRMYEERLPRKQMDLDAAILDAIKRFPDLRVHFEGNGGQVVADSLLPDIFAILFGQARKRGGPGVEISISLKEGEAERTVILSDSGPALPEGLKEEVLERPEAHLVRGRGLGLSIVRSMVEWYGGRVAIDDGAILITFKK